MKKSSSLVVLSAFFVFVLTWHASHAAFACTDSDGGRNYFMKGVAISNGMSQQDVCLDEFTLVEKYCSGSEIMWEHYKCPIGCSDGACISSSSPVTGNAIGITGMQAASGYITISGNVKDSAGNGVSNAVVNVIDGTATGGCWYGPPAQGTATTDSAGHYVISNYYDVTLNTGHPPSSYDCNYNVITAEKSGCTFSPSPARIQGTGANINQNFVASCNGVPAPAQISYSRTPSTSLSNPFYAGSTTMVTLSFSPWSSFQGKDWTLKSKTTVSGTTTVNPDIPIGWNDIAAQGLCDSGGRCPISGTWTASQFNCGGVSTTAVRTVEEWVVVNGVESSHIYYYYRCSDAPNPTTCIQDSLRCDSTGNWIQKCTNAANGIWTSQAPICAYGCDSSATPAACKTSPAQVCTENAMRCNPVVSGQLQKCTSNAWVYNDICTYGCDSTATPAACKPNPNACIQDSLRCDSTGNWIQKCTNAANGIWTSQAPICAYGCDSITNPVSCKSAPACTDACTGNQCVSEGSTWYKECADTNGDGCMELSVTPNKACASGTKCYGGFCASSPPKQITISGYVRSDAGNSESGVAVSASKSAANGVCFNGPALEASDTTNAIGYYTLSIPDVSDDQACNYYSITPSKSGCTFSPLNPAQATGGNIRQDIVSDCGNAAPSCNSYTISPVSNTVGSGTGAGSIDVRTVPGNCAWTAESDSAWLTITSGASGTGHGTVNYNYGQNTGAAPRPGTITIGDREFSLTQGGTVCTADAECGSGMFCYAGGCAMCSSGYVCNNDDGSAIDCGKSRCGGSCGKNTFKCDDANTKHIMKCVNDRWQLNRICVKSGEVCGLVNDAYDCTAGDTNNPPAPIPIVPQGAQPGAAAPNILAQMGGAVVNAVQAVANLFIPPRPQPMPVPSSCTNGNRTCSGTQPQICQSNSWQRYGQDCGAAGCNINTGACYTANPSPTPPSCINDPPICNGNKVQSCSSGSWADVQDCGAAGCSAGVCNTPVTCYDSDGGQNYLVNGYVTVSDSPNVVWTDYCTAGTLTEYYCSGSSVAHQAFPCPGGATACSSGKCACVDECTRNKPNFCDGASSVKCTLAGKCTVRGASIPCANGCNPTNGLCRAVALPV